MEGEIGGDNGGLGGRCIIRKPMLKNVLNTAAASRRHLS
eukprot:COSAG02_NODE_56145_length_287_cov_0.494681_1_plen_38_part_10